MSISARIVLSIMVTAIALVAVAGLGVLWASPQDAEVSVRLLLAWAAGLASVVGLFVLWLLAKLPRPLAGGLMAAAIIAAVVFWYNNAALAVYPTAATLRQGEILALTATPWTIKERILGKRAVVWLSQNDSTASVTAAGDSVYVRAKAPGRATIYAVRKTARSQSRITVTDSSGAVPPLCGHREVSRAVRRDTTAGRSAQASADTADASGARQATACLSGSIVSPDGQPLPRVEVALTAIDQGGDTLWKQYATTDPVDGRYEFLIASLPNVPVDSMIFRLIVDRQVVEKRHTWLMPTQWGLDTASRVIDGHLLTTGVYRDLDINLRYSTHSAFYILLLLLPAILGLLSTVLYRHWYGIAAEQREDQAAAALAEAEKLELARKRWEKRARYLTLFYVFGNASIWGILLAVFAWTYAFRSIQTISLFNPRIVIPVLAPTFAFIGVLVWATYVLSRREAATALRPSGTNVAAHLQSARQNKLLAIGNRIMVAPYLAIVIVLLLNFEDQADPQIPFFAFFTGLWIEPVLRLIKDIGDRLTIHPSRGGLMVRGGGAGGVVGGDAANGGAGDGAGVGGGTPSPGTGPQIFDVKQDPLPNQGGELRIVVTGTGFVAGAKATLDGLPMQVLTTSATEIAVKIPIPLLNGSGPFAVKVINPDGTSSDAKSIAAQL
jgi:hypothetical protein